MTDLMERGAGEASAMSDVSTPYEVQPTVGQLSDHTNGKFARDRTLCMFSIMLSAFSIKCCSEQQTAFNS